MKRIRVDSPRQEEIMDRQPRSTGMMEAAFRRAQVAAHLYDTIRHGDRVTVVNRLGQERSGRATIRNREADVWVLNMGGPHGTPGIATRDNVVRVKHSNR